jgi:hypothetical protein
MPNRRIWYAGKDTEYTIKELRRCLGSFEKDYMAIKDKFAELEVLGYNQIMALR